MAGEKNQDSQNTPGSQRPSYECFYCGKDIREIVFYRPGQKTCDDVDCLKKTKLDYCRKNISKLLMEAGIPQKFQCLSTDRDLSKYTVLNTGLYCYGDVGTGKTVFACSLAKELILQGRQVRFFSTLNLILSLYDRWRRPEDQIKSFIDDNLIIPEILILDDLGSEKLTDYVRTTFFYIFNEREGKEKLTIVTSNHSLEKIDEYLGCRISSRIAGCCKIIKFTGQDRRLHKGNEVTR